MSERIWPFRFALRALRRPPSTLVILATGIAVAVALAASLHTLSQSLLSGIDIKAREMLTGDLVVRSSRPISDEIRAKVRSQARQTAEETSFLTMIRSDSGRSRLSQISAVSKEYPLVSGDTGATRMYSELHRRPVALLDDVLFQYLQLQDGDTIQIGLQPFTAKLIDRQPGDTSIRMQLAPKVVIGAEFLPALNLLQLGSRSSFKLIVLQPDPELVKRLNDSLSAESNEGTLSTETVDEKKLSFGQAVQNVTKFVHLISIAAMLFAGTLTSFAASLFSYRILPTVQALRALGATGRQSTTACALQIGGMAGAGAVVGLAAVPFFSESVASLVSFALPVPVTLVLSSRFLVATALLTTATALLWAAGPLAALQKVSPARYGDSAELQAGTKWWLRLGQLFAVFGLSYLLIHDVRTAAAATAAIAGSGVVIGLLFRVMCVGLQWIPEPRSFARRQARRNILRERRYSRPVALAVGGVAAVLVALVTVSAGLRSTISSLQSTATSNIILFDIQSDQLPGVRDELRALHLPETDYAPLISMRLVALNGKAGAELLKEPGQKIPAWTLTRDYRSTYRSELADTEQLVEGEFPRPSGALAGDEDEPFPVTIERGMAEKLAATLGDRLQFNVQGIIISAVIRGIREVDWFRVRPNFFFVFPEGTFDTAPQTHLLGVRADTAADLNALYDRLQQNFPNVSLIDARIVAETLSDLLSQLMLTIFLLTGALLLLGISVVGLSAIGAARARTQSIALYRVIGATRRDIGSIVSWEALFLGALTSFVAALLGLSLGAVGLRSLIGSARLSQLHAQLGTLNMLSTLAFPGIAIALAACLIIALTMVLSTHVFQRSPIAQTVSAP